MHIYLHREVKVKISRRQLKQLIVEVLSDIEQQAASEAQKELEGRFPDMDFSVEKTADKYGAHAQEWDRKSKLALDAFDKWSNEFHADPEGVAGWLMGDPSAFKEQPERINNLIKDALMSAPEWARATREYIDLYDSYNDPVLFGNPHEWQNLSWSNWLKRATLYPFGMDKETDLARAWEKAQKEQSKIPKPNYEGEAISSHKKLGLVHPDSPDYITDPEYAQSKYGSTWDALSGNVPREQSELELEKIEKDVEAKNRYEMEQGSKIIDDELKKRARKRKMQQLRARKRQR